MLKFNLLYKDQTLECLVKEALYQVKELLDLISTSKGPE